MRILAETLGTPDDMATMLVAAVLAAFLMAVLAASLLIARRLLPLLRSISDAVRTPVDGDDDVTAIEASSRLSAQLSAARAEIRDVRSEVRTIAGSQERTDRRVDHVDDRVTDLSERVRVVEKSTARAHDRIDRIPNTGA